MIAIGMEEQIDALAKLLKPLGFKKHRATWHRITLDSIQTINVQASQWGPDYYLNVGTYLRALGEELKPPEFRCHVRERIHPPNRPALVVVQECQNWFVEFGAVPSLVLHHKSGSLPLATAAAAKEWLSAV